MHPLKALSGISVTVSGRVTTEEQTNGLSAGVMRWPATVNSALQYKKHTERITRKNESIIEEEHLFSESKKFYGDDVKLIIPYGPRRHF